MTKAAYLALPNSERYAAAQAILKSRKALVVNRQTANESGIGDVFSALRAMGVDTFRYEIAGQNDWLVIEVSHMNEVPKWASEIRESYEFESKALIFEPTN